MNKKNEVTGIAKMLLNNASFNDNLFIGGNNNMSIIKIIRIPPPPPSPYTQI